MKYYSMFILWIFMYIPAVFFVFLLLNPYIILTILNKLEQMLLKMEELKENNE